MPLQLNRFPLALPVNGISTFRHRALIGQQNAGYSKNWEVDRAGALTPVLELTNLVPTGGPTDQCWGQFQFIDIQNQKWFVCFYAVSSTQYGCKVSLTPSVASSWRILQWWNGSSLINYAWDMSGIPSCDSARGVLWITNGINPVQSWDGNQNPGADPTTQAGEIIQHDGSVSHYGSLQTYQIDRGRWAVIWNDRLFIIAPPGYPNRWYASLEAHHNVVGSSDNCPANQLFWEVDSKDGDNITGFWRESLWYVAKNRSWFVFSGQFEPDQSDMLPAAYWMGSLRCDQIEGVFGATHHRHIGFHPTTRQIVYHSWDGFRSIPPVQPGVHVEPGASRLSQRIDFDWQDVIKGGGMYDFTAPDDPSLYNVGTFRTDYAAEWHANGAVSGQMVFGDGLGGNGGIELQGGSNAEVTGTGYWTASNSPTKQAVPAINDGDSLTYYSIFGAISWGRLFLDLGSAQNVNVVKLTHLTTFNWNEVVRIAVSDDGLTWTYVRTLTVNEMAALQNNPSTEYTFQLPATYNKRYVGIEGTTVPGPFGSLSIAEIHAWNISLPIGSGTYTSVARKANIPTSGGRWGIFRVQQKIAAINSVYNGTWSVSVSTDGSSWTAYQDITASVGQGDTASFDLQSVLGGSYPIATYPYIKWKVVYDKVGGAYTIPVPECYSVIISWVEGDAVVGLQGCGCVGERLYYSLSHSAVADTVLEMDHLGGWWLRSYGASTFPGSFIEFNGAGYCSMIKKFSSSPQGSLYLMDSQNASVLTNATLITEATDCKYPGDKEFMGAWVTYRQKAGTIQNKANACDVYFNVDDLTQASGTNFITSLSWIKLGTTCSIVTDGSFTLTTQVYPFAVLSGLCKGRRASLKFVNHTDVEIDDYGFIWRPLPTGPLDLDRGLDNRGGQYEYQGGQ